MLSKSIDIQIPKAHPKQNDFISSSAKRKVIVAGRRGGKTMGESMLATRKFLEGRRILYAAPKQDQTDWFWDYCKGFLQVGISENIIYKNETKRLLSFGEARIRAKTAWDADGLRGDYADLLILDEYALMNPNTWEEVGVPMLLDNDGDAIFSSTPKRHNHFFKLYQKAIESVNGRWAAWHFTSHDNPHLSKGALEEITSDMTENGYRQEILAEFLESEGMVFRNIQACMNAKKSSPDDHKGHILVMGVDWGKHQDFTALSVGCRNCQQEVAIDRFNQIDYTFQRGRLRTLYDKWNVSNVLAESNAMGEPIIDQLRTEGINVHGFQTTAITKPQMITNLALIFERQEFQFIDDPVWTGELESYEQKVSANTGRSTYSAPEGMNDDTVIARALMAQAAQRPTPSELIAFI